MSQLPETEAALSLAPPPPDLHTTLVVLTEDIFFTVAGAARLELDVLRSLAQKRMAILVAAARGAPFPSMNDGEAWVVGLSVALAALSPPRWIPFADAIEAGLSLEHGARGVRSLFTSKPSDKDVTRVKNLGALAVRAITSVLGATGALGAEASMLRRALLASFALPEADRAELEAEPFRDAESLSISGDVDAKVARSLVRAGFYAARLDGTDPREEQAVITIARKLGLTSEEVNAARDDARASMDARKAFGDASVEAVRFVLEGSGELFARAAMLLTLSPIQRHDALASIQLGAPVTLNKRHRLDKKQREAALALAWAAALRGNPTVVARAALAERHDSVAADLGDGDAGHAVRTSLELFVEQEIARVARAASG